MKLFDLFKSKPKGEIKENKKITKTYTVPFFLSSTSNTVPPSVNKVYAYRGWIYRIISLIGTNIASAKWFIKDQKGESVNHEALRLLRKPNPFQNSYQFWMFNIANLEINGRALIQVIRNGRITMLLPLNSLRYQKKVDDSGRIYYQHVGKEDEVEDEVIDIYYPDPNDILSAKSPLDAISYEYQIDSNTKDKLLALFTGGSIPAAIVSVNGEAITKEDLEKLKLKWKAQFNQPTSEPEFIANATVEVHELSVKPGDLKLLESQKLMRDFILQLWGIPPELLGVVENSNRATAYQARLIFTQNVIIPRLELLKSTLNEDFLWKFWRDNIEFDYEFQIPEDKELEIKKIDIYMKHGIYTINDVRRKEGLEEVEWGNSPWLPANLLPLKTEKRFRIGMEITRNTELQNMILDEFISDIQNIKNFKELRATIDKWLDRFDLPSEYKITWDLDFNKLEDICYTINKIIYLTAEKAGATHKYFLSEKVKILQNFNKFFKIGECIGRFPSDFSFSSRIRKNLGILIPIFQNKEERC